MSTPTTPNAAGRARLVAFLDRFPDNATSWAQATDEVREIARNARLIHDRHRQPPLPPVDFGLLDQPSQWNTTGKRFILDAFDRMGEQGQRELLYFYAEWFGC